MNEKYPSTLHCFHPHKFGRKNEIIISKKTMIVTVKYIGL